MEEEKTKEEIAEVRAEAIEEVKETEKKAGTLTEEHENALSEFVVKLAHAVDNRILELCNILGAGVDNTMDDELIQAKLRLATIDVIHYHKDVNGEMHKYPGWYIYQFGILACIVGEPRPLEGDHTKIEIPVFFPTNKDDNIITTGGNA